MLGKKAKSRFALFVFLLIAAIVIVIFVFKSLEENVVYFFSPTEISNKNNLAINKKIRIGGLVKERKYFVADKILAKHDENYMPPEVNKALEKSNQK